MGLFRKRAPLAKIMEELKEAPLGPERVRLAEQGIAAALAEGNDDGGFACREDLLLTSCLLGQVHRAIPAMEWCLAKCDADPERFAPERVLFQYKWILEDLPRHVSFSRETIENGLSDLERRFDAMGWNRRGPLEVRVLTNWTMMRIEEADAIFPRWEALARDKGSDCPACATALKVRYHVGHAEHSAAAGAAAPLMDGSQSCMEEPARCFSRLQFSLAALDRFEDAIRVHRESLEHVADGYQFFDARASHMLFCVLFGNLELASRLLEISLPQAVRSGVDMALLRTCDTGDLVMEVLRRRHADMPNLDAAPEVGVREVADWPEWLAATADRLAGAFDERNGNDAWAKARASTAQIAEQLGSLR